MTVRVERIKRLRRTKWFSFQCSIIFGKRGYWIERK
jgi:hypothetical protein